MQGSEKEQDPRDPSMNYVKPLVRHTGNEANEIVFASKKDQEGYLSHCQPRCSDTQRLLMLRTWSVIVDKLECKNEA